MAGVVQSDLGQCPTKNNKLAKNQINERLDQKKKKLKIKYNKIKHLRHRLLGGIDTRQQREEVGQHGEKDLF